MRKWNQCACNYRSAFFSLTLVLQLEALLPEAIHGMIQMPLSSRNAVRLVGITQLIENYVGFLQRPRQHHAVLIVHVIVGVAMNQEEIVLPNLCHMSSRRNIAFHVVCCVRICSHIALSVNRIVIS